MGQPTKMEEIGRELFWSNLKDKAAQQRTPLHAKIELTYGCNLRCVHCYNPTHQARDELTTDQWCRILDQLAQQGCLHLAFTGGELLARKDCFEIFTHAKDRGFTINILTNATLITPSRADRLQALKPYRVELSLYGATAETYERVTGIAGSYHRFVEGIQLLRERKIPIVVKMPVMTLNQHEVGLAQRLVQGWGIQFVYATDIHPRVDGSLEPLDYRLAPAEVVGLNQDLVGYTEWSAEGSGEKHGTCGDRGEFFNCSCGKTSLAVTPYGQMNLCLALPIPGYDLRQGTVAEGWRELVKLVDDANARPGPTYECPSCDLQSHCRQGPMDAYLETGNLDPCLPYFKELAQLEKQCCQPSEEVGKFASTAHSKSPGRTG